MKFSRFPCPLAFAAAIAFTSALPANAVIVINGGFETGDLTGWTQFGNTGDTGVVAGFSHSGSFSFYDGAIGSLGGIHQVLTTSPGDSYTLDFWLQNNGGTPSEFQVSWNAIVEIDTVNPAVFGWTEYTFPVTGTGSDTLTFAFRQDPNWFHLDDISVTENQVPDVGLTSSLLGLGLLSLAVLRRKLR